MGDDTNTKQTELEVFKAMMTKMGKYHNYYVNLEVNGEYKGVPVMDLIEQARAEERVKFARELVRLYDYHSEGMTVENHHIYAQNIMVRLMGAIMEPIDDLS
jgi:hypothetical protein